MSTQLPSSPKGISDKALNQLRNGGLVLYVLGIVAGSILAFLFHHHIAGKLTCASVAVIAVLVGNAPYVGILYKDRDNNRVLIEDVVRGAWFLGSLPLALFLSAAGITLWVAILVGVVSAVLAVFGPRKTQPPSPSGPPTNP
jgi:O-antigen/teichoic acid export membrane protein